MDRYLQQPLGATTDQHIARESFIGTAMAMGVDEERATLIFENSGVVAVADGEDWPDGSLDLLEPKDRQVRAQRIGVQAAIRICRPLVK